MCGECLVQNTVIICSPLFYYETKQTLYAMMLVVDDTEKGEYVRHDELLSLIEFHSCS
jgi:hypothetical protein